MAIKIQIETAYNGAGAQQAKKDKEALEQPSPSAPTPQTSTQATRAQRDAERQFAREQADSRKKAADDYKTQWQNAVNEEKRQKTAAAKEAAAASAAEKARSEEAWKRTEQTKDLRRYDEELAASELRAKGKNKEAEAAEKKLFIDRHSEELQRKMGISQAEAVKRAERMHAVSKAAEGHGGHGGVMGLARTGGELTDAITGGSGYVMRFTQLARMGTLAAEGGPIAAAAAAALLPVVAYGIYRSMRKGVSDERLALNNKLREEGIADASRIERLHKYGNPDESAELALGLSEENKQIRGRYQTVADEGHRGLMGGLIQWFRNKTGWDVAERGIPGIPFYRTETQQKTEELMREEERNREQQRKAEQERKYWNERVTMPGVEATELRGEGKTAEARHIEKEMALAEERKRLEKLMPDNPEGVERGVSAKRNEIENAGYNDFMQHGGYDDVRATELRAQGKMKEARALEYDSLWWSKYNDVLGKVGDEHADVAKEAADADVFAKKRQDAGNFAKVLDARAGAAEIFRVATLAAQYSGIAVNGSGVHDELKQMHGTMRDAYLKGTEAAWREKFHREPYR